MRFIRQSLTHKTSFLGAVLLLAGLIFYITVTRANLTSFTFTAGQLLLLLYVFFGLMLLFFVTHVLQPLNQIVRQVKAIKTGKKYAQIELKNKIDELGLLASFLNEVISMVEQVSGDIKDKRRLTDELNFAGKVQRHLLPKKAPVIPGLDVVVKTRSASEVGGDNFDIINREKDTLMYIGDATGHGFPAGLVMSMVNVLMQSAAKAYENTSDILINVNKALQPKTTATMFMTLAMLRWEHEQQKIFYTGCGHEHILIYRANTGKCEATKTGGIALGMVPNIEKLVKEQTIDLAPNDTIVLFTDGITEAKNTAGEMFGIERLRQLVEESSSKKRAESIFSTISKKFANFVGPNHIQDDDITLLVLKYNFQGVKKEGLRLDVDTSGIDAIEKPNWDW